MAWSWGLAVLAVELPLATIIFMTGPGRTVNRLLATFLLLEAIIVASYNDLIAAQTTPALAAGFSAISAVSISTAEWVYLLFLGAVLRTPLVEPFRTKTGRGVLYGLIVVCAPLFFLFPEQFVHVDDATGMLVAFSPAAGLTFSAFFNGLAGLVFLYGFFAAVSAYRRAPPGTATRRRAKLYAVSFGLRDLLLGPVLVLSVMPQAQPFFGWLTGIGVFPVSAIVILYVVILGYAVLRWELFDIEVKIKRTVRGGYVAGAFLAAYFVVDQLVQVVAGQLLGNVAGAIAAGLLLFALQPILHFSRRLADATLPKVQATPEYLAFRKLEVYQAALESSLEGGVSEKEQRTLNALRAKLGIARADADALERDVAAAFSPGRGPPRPATA